MDVVLRLRRHVEVDDMTEIRDIDAACRDVGRDEHADRTVLETVERSDTRRLRAIAVNARGGHAMLLEQLEQAVGAVLRAREHQRLLHVTAFQQLDEERRLEVLRHGIQRLRDAAGRCRLALEIDLRGVLLQLLRQLDDRIRHRGAEEEHLLFGGQVAQNSLDVGQESHVEHAIRFVQHQMLHRGQRGVRLRHVIEQPTRRGHHQVYFRAEGMLLRTHADAAVDRGTRQRRMHRERLRRFEDLQREFTRRYHDQRARGAARTGQHAVQNRQQECCRLATTRLRTRQHVPSVARGRNGVGLNRRRTRKPQLLDGLHEGRVERQGGERGNGHGTLGQGTGASDGGTLPPGPCIIPAQPRRVSRRRAVRSASSTASVSCNSVYGLSSIASMRVSSNASAAVRPV